MASRRAVARGSVHVRVRPETQAKLRELAEGRPLSQYLETLADEAYRRKAWERFNDGFAKLKADPQAWAAYQEERRELDGTLADGLEDEDGVEWDDSLTDAASW